MYLFLSKLLPVIFFPISLAALFLFISLFLKKTRLRKWLVIAAFLLIWIMGNGWFSSIIVQSLEWQYLPQETYPVVDAIVILGGGTMPVEYPRTNVELNFAGDRMLYGARLYREGLAPVVIVTAGNLSWTDAERSPAQDMLELLEFMGVPKEVILVEEASLNTYENALYTNEILEELGAERILLVTSAMHMPRSAPLFDKYDYDVIPAPTDYTVTLSPNQKSLAETWPSYFFSLFPNAEALNHTTYALKEYIGIAIYTLRGWY